jgi:hypothetical protein
VELLIQRYLKEKYAQTSYSTNVYLTLGPLAPRLTRVTRENLKNMQGLTIECTFRTRKRKSKGDGKAGPGGAKPKPSNGMTQSAGIKKKRKRPVPGSEDDDEVVLIPDEDIEEQKDTGLASRGFDKGGDGNDDDDEIVDDWSHTMRSDFPPSKRRRSSEGPQDNKKNVITNPAVGSDEIFILSDD